MANSKSFIDILSLLASENAEVDIRWTGEYQVEDEPECGKSGRVHRGLGLVGKIAYVGSDCVCIDDVVQNSGGLPFVIPLSSITGVRVHTGKAVLKKLKKLQEG